MAETNPSEKLLFKVIDDLREFMPHLVLVGGWVPYLYTQYTWQQEFNGKSLGVGSLQPTTVITTTDMDFGVALGSYTGSESIADHVRKLGYGERHLSMDRPTPFVPIVKGKDGYENAPVEFITVLNPPEFVREKLVGKEIVLNTVQDFEILLESPATFTLDSHKVQIPAAATFVFHKLLTFVLRDNEDKKRKDLYYVYYMLRFCPDKVALVNDVKNLIKGRKEGKKVLKNIKSFFAHKDDKGPVAIERENGTDYFISNVREDAYERIKQLSY